MTKSVQVDFSTDRLLQTAEKLIDAHDYTGALKILNKNAELNDELGYAHLLYAQIFDDIGLYERSINEWFKFLAYGLDVKDEDLSEAYEGLAVAFLNVGNEQFSAYYYNKLLEISTDIGEDMRFDIMDSFLPREDNYLKFVYPPEIADYSDEVSKGIELMKVGEYGKAIKEFEKVEQRNKLYFSAQNFIAMCYIIDDKPDKAEQVCLDLLKIKPDDVRSLTTLVAVKTEQKKYEESKLIAEKLLSLKIDSAEDIFKTATVCCENGMHEQAYYLLERLDDKLPYDSSVLYFKAIAAFNCGKYDKCLSAFDRLLTINPNAVTAKYYREAAKIAIKKGDATPMSYFYRLPQKERESSIKILAALGSLTSAQIKRAFSEVDLSDCVRWCFDEHEGAGSTELQTLGGMCAVRCGLNGLIEEILLNAFISDDIKIRMLTEMGEANEEKEIKVVICNTVKNFTFRKLHLGRTNRKVFIKAYSTLTAHFALINEDFSEIFAYTAEKLYDKLLSEDKLKSVKDKNELAAAILIDADLRLPRMRKRADILKYFSADGKRITEIYGV